MKIRVFTVLLATAILLPSCALNLEKDESPISSNDGVNIESVSGEDDALSSENDNREENDETVGLSRPGVASPGTTKEETTEEETTKPETTEPETTKPVTTKPETTKPVTTEPEVTEPITEAPVEVPSDAFVPYDVPLTVEQQKTVEKVAERFSVDEELIFGVMYVESKYDINAVSKNGRYVGPMQISKGNLNLLQSRCGVTDLMDFEQNVIGGSYFLNAYMTRYAGNVHITLLYYHGGSSYGDRLITEGQYEDSYSRAVVKEMERIVEARKALAAEMGVTLSGELYWEWDFE